MINLLDFNNTLAKSIQCIKLNFKCFEEQLIRHNRKELNKIIRSIKKGTYKHK